MSVFQKLKSNKSEYRHIQVLLDFINKNKRTLKVMAVLFQNKVGYLYPGSKGLLMILMFKNKGVIDRKILRDHFLNGW